MPCAIRSGPFVALLLLAAPTFAAPTRTAYVIGSNDASIARVDLIAEETTPNVASLGSIANRISGDAALEVAAIVSSGSDDVRAFDLLSETITSVIDLPSGSNPWDVEIVDDLWYVTSLLQDRVLVVDPAAAAVVDSIDVGQAPQGLCESGGKLYVTNTAFSFVTFSWGPGSVSVIDLASRDVIATVPVALNPQECLTTSDGRVHVVCTGDFFLTEGAVQVIDPLTDTVVDTLPVPGYPGTGAATDSLVWLGVTTTGFSSAIVGYRAQDLTWVRDDNDPLLPSFDFYGNVRTSVSGQVLVTDFPADLLLVENPSAPGSPAAYLVGDGPVDLLVVERTGPVSLALSGLSAVDTEEGVRLAWHSGAGAGLRAFSIERSAPGAAREQVAEVVAGTERAEWVDRDAPYEVPLTWHVAARDLRGHIVGTASTTLIRRTRDESRLAIRQLHPNPSRDAVTIDWFAPTGGLAHLELLDVTGRRITSIDLGSVAHGEGSVRWDGRDARGRPGAPGVFFARLTVGGQRVVERGLRLR